MFERRNLSSNFFGDLPHLAELNMPQSRGAAKEHLAYDDLKACGRV
jgi:hypothetical protein